MLTWLTQLARRLAPRTSRPSKHGSRPRRSRPHIESLEDRTVPTAGALDLTFGVNGQPLTDIETVANSASDDATAAAVQADGKIVVVGATFRPESSDFLVLRYNTDGTLDDTFGNGGRVLIDFGNRADFGRSVALVGSQILVAGDAEAGFAAARLNADGSLDTSFGAGGKVLIDFGGAQESCWSLTVTGSQYVLAGRVQAGARGADIAVARLNEDGTLDSTFGAAGKAAGPTGPGRSAPAVHGPASASTERSQNYIPSVRTLDFQSLYNGFDLIATWSAAISADEKLIGLPALVLPVPKPLALTILSASSCMFRSFENAVILTPGLS